MRCSTIQITSHAIFPYRDFPSKKRDTPQCCCFFFRKFSIPKQNPSDFPSPKNTSDFLVSSSGRHCGHEDRRRPQAAHPGHLGLRREAAALGARAHGAAALPAGGGHRHAGLHPGGGHLAPKWRHFLFFDGFYRVFHGGFDGFFDVFWRDMKIMKVSLWVLFQGFSCVLMGFDGF